MLIDEGGTERRALGEGRAGGVATGGATKGQADTREARRETAIRDVNCIVLRAEDTMNKEEG